MGMMERKSKKILCRFCSTVVSNNSFKVADIGREVLNNVLPDLNVKEEKDSVICNACYMKLIEAFQFKAICMDTENSIYPYVGYENLPLVDLKEIFLKIRRKEHPMPFLKHEKICRLCMKVLTCGYIPLTEIDTITIGNYIPEVNFRGTKKPVICRTCLNLLETHISFLENCLNVEKENQNIYDNKTSINERDKNGSDGANRKSILIQHQPRHKCDSKTYIYKCITCGFKAKHKCNLLRHQKTRRDQSEYPVYKCDLCSYRAKNKFNFKAHMLSHNSQTQKYKCDICDYESSEKSFFKFHQKRHKVSPDVQMYKSHQLKHKGSPDVEIYKCVVCKFETKYKESIVSHQLSHKNVSNVKMYECDACSYVTIHKKSFRNHQVIHKKLSELKVYKCDMCDYYTRKKCNLTQHQQSHKSTSKV